MGNVGEVILREDRVEWMEEIGGVTFDRCNGRLIDALFMLCATRSISVVISP